MKVKKLIRETKSVNEPNRGFQIKSLGLEYVRKMESKIVAEHNIEFSCRPESKPKHLLLPRRHNLLRNDNPGGQLQRFVRFQVVSERSLVGLPNETLHGLLENLFYCKEVRE